MILSQFEEAVWHRRGSDCDIEGLDLALLVETEHDGVGWRIDIKTDDLLELLGELGIVGELERAHPMRLEPVPLPDPPHRGSPKSQEPRPGCMGFEPHARLTPFLTVGPKAETNASNSTSEAFPRLIGSSPRPSLSVM